MLFNFAIHQLQLLLQRGMTMLWQRLNQIFDHCSQSSSNLHILYAALPDFSECEMHKVFPIRSSKNYDQLARFVEYFVRTQILVSGFP